MLLHLKYFLMTHTYISPNICYIIGNPIHILKPFDDYAFTLPCGYWFIADNKRRFVFEIYFHFHQNWPFWTSGCLCKCSLRKYNFVAISLCQETVFKIDHLECCQFCIKCLDQHPPPELPSLKIQLKESYQMSHTLNVQPLDFWISEAKSGDQVLLSWSWW